MSSGRRVAHQASLRARTTSWYVSLLAVALIIFSISIYMGLHAYLKQSLERGLAGTVHTLVSEFLSKLPDKGENWVLGEVRESYAATPGDHFLRLSKDGAILYQTADMRQPAIRISQLPLSARSQAGKVHAENVGPEKVLIYSQPFIAPDGRVFEVEAGTSVSAMNQTLHWLAKILVLSTTLILVLAVVGGYFLMEHALRPLAILTEKAALIGHKQLGGRLPVIPTGDELERLTHSLNSMIERLEQALDHNYRFSADASHELRTPLTIVRGELEEMLRTEELPPAATENVISMLDEVDRMSRIVNSLMTITRLDAGGERMNGEPIDFSSLVEATTEHLKLLAEEKGLSLQCNCDPGVIVFGDAMRLKQVVVNLVDNAIKYSPSTRIAQPPASARERTVSINVTAEDSEARLRVGDQGVGIPKEALPHVFERFYRADYARSRGHGGVGLGLAIVKAIVSAHDGSVSIHSVENEGSVVTVTLPLSQNAILSKEIAPPLRRQEGASPGACRMPDHR